MYIHIFACIYIYDIFGVSQVALVVKKQSTNAGDIRDSGFDPWIELPCPSQGWEDPLEEPMATHLAGYSS